MKTKRIPNILVAALAGVLKPGKGWFTLFRVYGPLDPWFDKTWKPGEIELVK